MRKELISKVMGNKVVKEVGKFYLAHESTILTGGAIGFSMATTAVTYRNADKIKTIISDASIILHDLKEEGTPKEQIREFYGNVLKELVPLVLPIVIFQAAVIGCSILNKKKSDKRIAELAGALSVSQAAIAQYQSFQKGAEEQLGEKKYTKLMDDIYKNQDVDGRLFSDTPLEGAPGEVLMIDKYSGRPFWAHTYRLEHAASELSRMLSGGGYDQISINDYYDVINNPNLTPNELGERFGYLADVGNTEVVARFADTHYVFPNGTRIPAFEVYLFPEPDYIG